MVTKTKTAIIGSAFVLALAAQSVDCGKSDTQNIKLVEAFTGGNQPLSSTSLWVSQDPDYKAVRMADADVKITKDGNIVTAVTRNAPIGKERFVLFACDSNGPARCIDGNYTNVIDVKSSTVRVFDLDPVSFDSNAEKKTPYEGTETGLIDGIKDKLVGDGGFITKIVDKIKAALIPTIDAEIDKKMGKKEEKKTVTTKKGSSKKAREKEKSAPEKDDVAKLTERIDSLTNELRDYESRSNTPTPNQGAQNNNQQSTDNSQEIPAVAPNQYYQYSTPVYGFTQPAYIYPYGVIPYCPVFYRGFFSACYTWRPWGFFGIWGGHGWLFEGRGARNYYDGAGNFRFGNNIRGSTSELGYRHFDGINTESGRSGGNITQARPYANNGRGQSTPNYRGSQGTMGRGGIAPRGFTPGFRAAPMPQQHMQMAPHAAPAPAQRSGGAVRRR